MIISFIWVKGAGDLFLSASIYLWNFDEAWSITYMYAYIIKVNPSQISTENKTQDNKNRDIWLVRMPSRDNFMQPTEIGKSITLGDRRQSMRGHKKLNYLVSLQTLPQRN
jgi:hypothetical protein